MSEVCTWEEYCEQGRTIRRQIDRCQWALGDLACEATLHYGEYNLSDFAREVGISKSSMYDYKKVSEFYPLFHRLEMFEDYEVDVITYGHYLAATRLSDFKEAQAWLNQAALYSITVDEFNKRIGDMLNNRNEPTSEPTSPNFPEPIRRYICENIPVKRILDPNLNRYVVLIDAGNLPAGELFASVWTQEE